MTQWLPQSREMLWSLFSSETVTAALGLSQRWQRSPADSHPRLGTPCPGHRPGKHGTSRVGEALDSLPALALSPFHLAAGLC